MWRLPPVDPLKALATVCGTFGFRLLFLSSTLKNLRPNGPHLSDIVVGLIILVGGIAIHQYAKRRQ